MIWDNDVSGCRFESGRWSGSIIYIHMWIVKIHLIDRCLWLKSMYQFIQCLYTCINIEITFHLIFTIWDQHKMTINWIITFFPVSIILTLDQHLYVLHLSLSPESKISVYFSKVWIQNLIKKITLAFIFWSQYLIKCLVSLLKH